MQIKNTFLYAFFLLISLPVSAQLTEKERADLSKHLDIQNAIFNELVLSYVDTIDIPKTSQALISDLLERQDPYTDYIPEESMTDFTFMATGEYGGIGSVISMSDSAVIIREPYQKMPAAEAGLRPGDQLIEIEGNDLKGKTTSYASDLLRGPANTSVKIKYLRPGEKLKEINITRKRIHVDPITYYGVIEDGIGYINLSTFTTESASAVESAFIELKKNHNIHSLIIDVRDNGGGVVEDCLDMLNLFIPKGDLLMTMKGRTAKSERIFRATRDAIDQEMPIVVLVNHSSASASEILSGAIQDWDRGVVIGTRTYGKGLVQSTRSLPYGGKLKLTTAKYYIPSGRSIQTIDYAQRDEQGRVTHIPDSLTKVFYTAAGRPVKDGSGIIPDIVVEEAKIPTIIYYLDGKQMYFNFVVDWRSRNPEIASPGEFVLQDEVYDEFKNYVQSKEFTYDLGSDKLLTSLKKMMEFEGYWDAASEQYAALESMLKPDLERDLELHKDQISKYLVHEIMRQYHYESGRLIYSLREDEQLDKAIEVLKDSAMYRSILSPVIEKD